MSGSRRLSVVGLLAVIVAGCGISHPGVGRPLCSGGEGSALILAVQSVPTAEYVPCINVVLAGWTFAAFEARNDRTRFWFDSDRAGDRFLEVILQADCNVDAAEEIPPGRDPRLPLASDQEGTRRYVDVQRVLPLQTGGVSEYRGSWFFRFEGGCVTYRFQAQGPGLDTLPEQVAEVLGFLPATALRQAALEEIGIETD